jgi:hypothetical protein
MNNRFYVRPTSEDQINAFVKEWQRKALLEQKELCLKKGKTIREIMIEEDDWESFSEACIHDGEDPEVACRQLQKLIDEVV